MSAHPTPDPPTCARCPEATIVLGGVRCPHLRGPLAIRRREDTCRLPRDRQVRLVAAARGAGERLRARLLAEQFGLPEGPGALDACARFGC